MTDQQTLDVGIEPERSPDEYRAGQEESEPVTKGSAVDDEDDYPYTGGEAREEVYTYNQSVCEEHPCPGQRESGDLVHHQSNFVSIGGDPDAEEELMDVMTPEECSCGGAIETETVSGEWPLDELTSESILDLFRETNGQIAIEFYPRSYDARFYIGEIGGRYCVEGEHYDTPDLPTGVDDLPALVREHPNRLSSVDGTSLEGIFEDYQNGVN